MRCDEMMRCDESHLYTLSFSVFDVLKKILSFSTGLFSILNGMFRAVVIAGVAGVAVAVPFRTAVFKRDVLQRAYLGADTA